MDNFSLSHSVSKRLVLQTHLTTEMQEKRLNNEISLRKIENILIGYQRFLPFPQCFQNFILSL